MPQAFQLTDLLRHQFSNQCSQDQNRANSIHIGNISIGNHSLQPGGHLLRGIVRYVGVGESPKVVTFISFQHIPLTENMGSSCHVVLCKAHIMENKLVSVHLYHLKS